MDVAGTGVALHLGLRVVRLLRLGLALGLRLVGFELPLGHLLVVVGLGGGKVGLHLDPAFHERLQLLVGGELVALHPGLGGAAAPGVIDQADRHAERLVELPAEEIADGRKIAHRVGRAGGPLAVEVPLWLLRAHLRHRDQADVGKLCGRLLEVGVVGVVDAPLHVRLAGTDPDLADEHVVERDRVLALDGERVRAAVFLHGIEEHVPHAVGAGGGRVGLAAERYRDRLARISLAPDFVLDALLEHHVVAEHVVERHVSPGWGRDGGEKAGNEADGMHRGGRGSDAHGRLLRVAICRDERKGKADEKRAVVYPGPTAW